MELFQVKLTVGLIIASLVHVLTKTCHHTQLVTELRIQSCTEACSKLVVAIHRHRFAHNIYSSCININKVMKMLAVPPYFKIIKISTLQMAESANYQAIFPMESLTKETI